jgi:HAD superfamily 5'-nucleotidase-like hydrolase
MRRDGELPAPVRAALEADGFDPDPPPERRIFTNRDLNFESVAVVGFDMDYTLAIYRQEAMEEVSRACTVAKLVARGYPEALLKPTMDPRFAVRGLMVDRALGNVLKQDRHGHVGRAYHGSRLLARDERRAIYRAQRLGQERERFTPVDTLFALPEVTLFAQIVDLADARPELWPGGAPPSYAEVFADVRSCIDEAHRDGSIKERIGADPGRYILRDPDLPRALHRLRSGGKRLFLLTNSLWPYTEVVMRHLLDGAGTAYAEWRSYFDWIVVGAAKPDFFTQQRPFLELDEVGRVVGPPRPTPSKGKAYAEGHQGGLQTALGVAPDEVLYVGDHIYGDVVRSKKSSGWRTALVVQELEHDLRVRDDHRLILDEVEGLHRLRTRLTEELGTQRQLGRSLGRLEPADVRENAQGADAARMLDEARVIARRRLDRLRRHLQETEQRLDERSLEVGTAFNPWWGSVFAERHDTSRFGAQVEFYACLYTSRASNFLWVSPGRYFHSPHGSLPHWRAEPGA